MKHILFVMVVANALAILGLNSCKKSDGLQDSGYSNRNSRHEVDTINLVAFQWKREANDLFSATFSNVIPLNSSGPVKIYLVTKDTDILINQAISFMNGELWATTRQSDIIINYRGSSKDLTYLNIKVVIG